MKMELQLRTMRSAAWRNTTASTIKTVSAGTNAKTKSRLAEYAKGSVAWAEYPITLKDLKDVVTRKYKQRLKIWSAERVSTTNGKAIKVLSFGGPEINRRISHLITYLHGVGLISKTSLSTVACFFMYLHEEPLNYN